MIQTMKEEAITMGRPMKTLNASGECTVRNLIRLGGSVVLSCLLYSTVVFQARGEDAAGEVNQASGQESKRILELEKYKHATAISPLLFGHNLETTRRGVWQGLGAERVANRKFAADLKRWTAIGPGETVLTRMFLARPSFASTFISPTMPIFAAP